MKNGCFCAKGQKYQEKIIGFPIIQHYIIIAFDKKCNKNFLSFILASHLVFTDIVSPVDGPRLACLYFRKGKLFEHFLFFEICVYFSPAFSSLLNTFTMKRHPVLEGPDTHPCRYVQVVYFHYE